MFTIKLLFPPPPFCFPLTIASVVNAVSSCHQSKSLNYSRRVFTFQMNQTCHRALIKMYVTAGWHQEKVMWGDEVVPGGEGTGLLLHLELQPGSSHSVTVSFPFTPPLLSVIYVYIQTSLFRLPVWMVYLMKNRSSPLWKQMDKLPLPLLLLLLFLFPSSFLKKSIYISCSVVSSNLSVSIFFTISLFSPLSLWHVSDIWIWTEHFGSSFSCSGPLSQFCTLQRRLINQSSATVCQHFATWRHINTSTVSLCVCEH